MRADGPDHLLDDLTVYVLDFQVEDPEDPLLGIAKQQGHGLPEFRQEE